MYSFEFQEHCKACGEPSGNAKHLGFRLNQSQGMRPEKIHGIAVAVMKCRNCEFVYANPLPVPESLEQHYGVPPESYWRDGYFEVSPTYFKQQIDQLKRLSGKKNLSGLKALDIGAGIGKCMIALEREGMEVHGLEPSTPFYDRAISKMGLSEAKLQNVPIEQVEYQESAFDFITFGAVLEHLYEPKESVLRALKWLKPGGYMQIEVPSNKWFTARLYNLIQKVRGTRFVMNISPMHTHFHINEFGLKTFQHFIKDAPAEIAHHEFYIGETYLPSLVSKLAIPYMKATNTGMQIDVWLRKTSN